MALGVCLLHFLLNPALLLRFTRVLHSWAHLTIHGTKDAAVTDRITVRIDVKWHILMRQITYTPQDLRNLNILWGAAASDIHRQSCGLSVFRLLSSPLYIASALSILSKLEYSYEVRLLDYDLFFLSTHFFVQQTNTKWLHMYRIHSCLFTPNCYCRQSNADALTLSISLTSQTGNAEIRMQPEYQPHSSAAVLSLLTVLISLRLKQPTFPLLVPSCSLVIEVYTKWLVTMATKKGRKAYCR